MHIHVVQITSLGSDILFSGKASNSFLEDEYTQRIHSVNEAIDSQVELKIIDKEWLRHVSLRNELLAGFDINILVIPHEVDAFALAEVHWLNNESFGFLLTELLFQVV